MSESERLKEDVEQLADEIVWVKSRLEQLAVQRRRLLLRLADLEIDLDDTKTILENYELKGGTNENL